MCLNMYWLHTKFIQRDRSHGKIIPKIIFIFFVNLTMDSPDKIMSASKERLDYLDNELYINTQTVLLTATLTRSGNV